MIQLQSEKRPGIYNIGGRNAEDAGMNTVLLKYQSFGHEYLVYDVLKYHDTISAHAIRTICSRNCGISSSGVVAGPYMEKDGSMKMKVFSPEGVEKQHDQEAESAGLCYLHDAGYLGRQNQKNDVQARAIGKIFLAEDFFAR